MYLWRCGCLSMCLCPCMCVKVKCQFWESSSISLHLFFETGSSAKSWFNHSAKTGWPASPGGLLVSASSPEVTDMGHHTLLSCECWGVKLSSSCLPLRFKSRFLVWEKISSSFLTSPITLSAVPSSPWLCLSVKHLPEEEHISKNIWAVCLEGYF